MVAISAQWIGPDGLGGAFKNTASALEAQTWYALGAKQGVVKGMTLAGVAGQMSIDVAAGGCLVSRLNGSQAVQDMGYLASALTTTRVTFAAASPAARNDALVCAVVDTTDGAVGTGALANGAHLVSVPGVSGTSTPRTDAQIAAYLGRGGFLRLADVPIASTDTQINMANVVLQGSAASANVFDTGWIQLAGVFANIHYRVFGGREVYVRVDGSATTTTGVSLDLTTVGIPVGFRPAIQARAGAYFAGYAGIVTVSATGAISALQNTGSNKGSVSVTFSYPIG